MLLKLEILKLTILKNKRISPFFKIFFRMSKKLKKNFKGVDRKVLNDDSMEKAFVLINAEMGAEIIDELKSIPEVKEVYGVYGVYDYIVSLEATSTDKLKDIVTNRIRRVTGVRSTLTMIVM
jgi:DNA-binding Lrp family transcriptional regulator